MKTIYFVTTNKGKINTLQTDFKHSGIIIEPVPIDIPEPRSSETKEIARYKVTQAYSELKKPCIAQDGGFYISSLNGFPRAFVNFALQTIGLEGILKLVEGKDRTCEFRDTLAYLDETLSEPMFFETHTKGTLAMEPRGELNPWNWGELHKIFIPKGLDRTFTQMSQQEMDEWRITQQKNWCGKEFAKWVMDR